MRIERLKSSGLTGLGDVDWTFPVGPVLLLCEGGCQQRMLSKLLLELFYDQKIARTLKAENNQGLFEVWMAGENTRFHISRDFFQKGNQIAQSSTLVTEEGSGQNVSLPETLTLGDYLFQFDLRAFRQGVVVDWPDKNERDHLNQLVKNLRQGGDERLSLIKVRASLAGAQKKVSEQKESMALVKVEYDALRREWEAAHRHQDEERLLLIARKRSDSIRADCLSYYNTGTHSVAYSKSGLSGVTPTSRGANPVRRTDPSRRVEAGDSYK